MTSEQTREIREILRDVAIATRDNGRRIDGLSSRMDDVVAELNEVKLQTALSAGHTVELAKKLESLDVASWDETTLTVRRLLGFVAFIRRRGVAISLVLLAGAGATEMARAILS